jgi:eukaryotic-like serine/threonine-protein kinase
MIICLDQRTGAGCGAQNRDNAVHCGQCRMPLRFALILRDPGALIGGYRIVRVIGHGACGAVYESAVAERPNAFVALKETFDPTSISSFQAEFAVLHQLGHPNLPRYDGMFEADGNGYLVMELIAGQSLQDVLDSQREPLPESQVLGYALQLCDVLNYLHGQQPPILHRDIKPANIRLTPEGRIKLVDFGLLKQGTQQTRMTIRGVGTPAYAPIEQYGRGAQHTDPRSDVYSLGATLYHLLSGQEPPPATDRVATSPDPLPTLWQYNPDLSAHVVDAVTTALSLAQHDRYADVAALRRALVDETAQQFSASHASSQGQPSAQPAAQPAASAGWSSGSPAQPRFSAQVGAMPLFALEQQRGSVTTVAFSPDGQTLASGGDDRLIGLWRASTGELLQTLYGHSSSIWGVAFSPDGRLIASAGADRTVRIWNAADGNSLLIIQAHTDKVIGVAFSPDGQLLASAGWDKIVRLWCVADGQPRLDLEGHTGRVYDIAFSPDGQLIASASADGTIKLWRAFGGRLLRTLEGHMNEVSSIAFSPDGQTLASAGDDLTVRLWHVADGRPLHTLQRHGEAIRTIAYHPSGRLLAIGSMDQQVRLWRIADDELLGTSPRHNGGIWCLAFSPNGRTLVTAGEDKAVWFWRVNEQVR